MIALEKVTLTIGGRSILNSVSLSVDEGESVALVGPNGSGKTSILRCLLALVPYEGTARVGRHDCQRQPIAARQLMAYVPQRPAFGAARVDEVVAFTARLRRVPAIRATEALAAVGLEPHAKCAARTLSGGMQQRLSLAVALLADAPVLLLDEPTASLDRQGQADFLDIAAGLRQRGRTLLLASHRPEEIARLADRVIYLEHGSVVAPPGSRSDADAVLFVDADTDRSRAPPARSRRPRRRGGPALARRDARRPDRHAPGAGARDPPVVRRARGGLGVDGRARGRPRCRPRGHLGGARAAP